MVKVFHAELARLSPSEDVLGSAGHFGNVLGRYGGGRIELCRAPSGGVILVSLIISHCPR